MFTRSAVSLWEEDITDARAMLKELRKNGIADVRGYLDSHPGFVREVAAAIRVLDVNEATLVLYEARRKEQLLGRLDVTLDLENDAVMLRSLKEMACAIDEGRRELQTESTARTLGGKPIALIVKSYIPPEGDKYPNMLVSLVDITERKRMEAEVARLKDQVEFILGATHTGLDIIDAQFNVRYVDPAWQKVYGDPRGRKCYEYFMGAKDVCGKCALPYVFRTRTSIVSEESLPREGNRLVQVTTVPYQDVSGERLAAEINVDITERRRMEERNRQLAALVESADDAIVGIDLDRTISVWNKGAERVYGYTAEEILGQPTSLLIPPELEDEARVMRETIERGERIEHFETVRLRKDGTRIDVSLTLFMVCDPDGRPAGMGSIARDITSRKATQARLERAQRLEGLAILAGGVAHQFNNINTVIKGYLDMIQDHKELPESLLSFAHGAFTGLQKSIDITDRLLTLTSPAAAGREVHLEDLARSALSLLQQRFNAENVALVVDLRRSTEVEADGPRLLSVISSLIVNALDSLVAQPVRRVTVANGCLSESVFLDVTDTGCGMPPESVARLFTPFYSTKGEWAPPDSPQAGLKGVGLSLSVGNATVTEYGGRIEVTSAPGVGSTFRLVLPCAPLKGSRGAASP